MNNYVELEFLVCASNLYHALLVFGIKEFVKASVQQLKKYISIPCIITMLQFGINLASILVFHNLLIYT